MWELLAVVSAPVLFFIPFIDSVVRGVIVLPRPPALTELCCLAALIRPHSPCVSILSLRILICSESRPYVWKALPPDLWHLTLCPLPHPSGTLQSLLHTCPPHSHIPSFQEIGKEVRDGWGWGQHHYCPAAWYWNTGKMDFTLWLSYFAATVSFIINRATSQCNNTVTRVWSK